MLTSFRWILIFCILLPLVGCCKIRSYKWHFDLEKHPNDDIKKSYVLHKGRWWNYYGRGLAFMAGGYWEDAIGDFGEALLQMQEDQDDARTYGLNRIDYYPNREAGIAYYKIGKYPEAYERLVFSLECVESSRVQYYLRELFENYLNSLNIDPVEPPTIELMHPKARAGENGIVEVKVKNRIVELGILIKDKNFIDSIWLDDKRLFFELGKKRFEFKIKQKLDYGDKYVEIRANNLARKGSSMKIHLTRTKPSRQISFQNKFITRSNTVNPKVLTRLVAYPAIFKKTAPLGPFAAKTGYDVLNLSLVADTSYGNDEQHSDSTIDEYTPDELLPPEERYRILIIPHKYLGIKKPLPSGRYLDEILCKELSKALHENDRFCPVELEDEELSEITDKLSNKARFKIKAVRKAVKNCIQDHEIDGILIGTIAPKEEEIKEVKTCLHDLEDYRDKILKASYQKKIKSDIDVYPFAFDLIDKIRSRFPFESGKITEVEENQFVCDFVVDLSRNYRLRKNMKLMIFKPSRTRLETQGKITVLQPKVQAKYCIRAEGEEVHKGYTVVTK